MATRKSDTILGIPQSTFTLGEISPSLAGRIDFDGYYKALRTCLNCTVSKYGGVENRAGTQFVSLVNDSANFTRMIPFQFNQAAKQQCILELGNQTMRVIYNGAIVLPGGVPLVVTTPWLSADLPLLKFTQSADVITVCHPNYPTQQISRLSATSWTVTPFANVNGPFQDINTNNAITVYASAVSGTVTLTASADLFTADMVGLEFYIGQSPDNTTDIWQVQITVSLNEIVMYGDNYYQAATAGTTGTYEPTVTQGSQKDGNPGVLWNYLHSGFGIVKITGFTDTKHVTATVLSRLPDSLVQGTPVIDITNVAPGQTSPTEVAVKVTTASPVLWATDAQVIISGVGGITAANGTWTVTVVDSLNFFLNGNTSTGTYTTGGTASSTATGAPTYNWALPSWGMTAKGYPGATSYFQDRQLFAGSNGDPFNLWMSTTAGFNDFTVSNPVLDTDAITYKLLSNQVDIIRHMLELTYLIIFTSGGIYMVQGGQSGNGVVTPSTINLTNQGANPCSDVPPLKISNYALFIQELGNQVRTLGYSFAENAFVGQDVTIMSNHLLQFNTITSWAYQEIPNSCIWAVRDDGVLLGLTFLPEQQITAWHRHDTQGTFEDVCCITEDGRNAVYFIVNRPGIGRCIERMAPRQFQDYSDAYFVDCGITYDGRATNTTATNFSGAAHLAGRTVSILVDGMVCPQFIMPANGEFTLPNPALVVHVGLPYVSDIETCDLSTQKADVRDKVKTVNSVSLIVDKSSGFMAGPDADNLQAYNDRSTENYDSASNPISDLVDFTIPCMWNKHGRIFVRQKQPLPLSILAVIPQVNIGGH